MDSTTIGQDRRPRVAAPARPRGERRPVGAGPTALQREAPARRVTGRPGAGRFDVGRPGAGRPPTGQPGIGQPGIRQQGFRRPGTCQPAAAPGALRIPASSRRVARAPFVLLVLCMLGGSLICLLVINTTLGAASFEIQRLQQSANARTVQEQQLEEQLATDENIATIQREACALGMRPQQELEFLNLRTHRIYESYASAATPAWCPR